MTAFSNPNLTIQRQKVLLVCDRPDEILRWTRLLPGSAIEMIAADTVDQAFEAWAENIPDLAIIDVNGSFPDGIEICQQLRQEAALPLLLVFNSCDERCLLKAYQAGADDCLVRPINPAVFLAKLNVWLRRSWMVPADTLPEIDAGGLLLDPFRRAAIFPDGRLVRLTNLEFRLLTLLMSNPGRSLSLEDIVRRVWGYSSVGDRGVMLKNVVYRLRKKIEPDPTNPVYLLTEPGQGYRFKGKAL